MVQSISLCIAFLSDEPNRIMYGSLFCCCCWQMHAFQIAEIRCHHRQYRPVFRPTFTSRIASLSPKMTRQICNQAHGCYRSVERRPWQWVGLELRSEHYRLQIMLTDVGELLVCVAALASA